MSVDSEERELPAIQRGLVDTCFEEGQYESAIDVLVTLCSRRYKPPQLHVRQLVYISLYPPAQVLTSNPDKLIDAITSPHELRLQKDDLWPKPSAREKALTLLRSYVNVNPPQSLMRAFPFYSYVDENGQNDVNPFSNENLEDVLHEDNTPLRDELLKFRSLKDCWGCMKDGFVKRKQQDTVSRSQRQTTLEEPMIVGPYAWPILEWLISVFEKDQELKRQTDGINISPLLLVQIPPPKIRRGPRIGLDIPIEIFRECFVSLSSFDASNCGVDNSYLVPEKRRELGMRLLSLVVNLTLTNPPLLPPSLVTERLAVILRSFQLDDLNFFFSSLSLNRAVFKMNILENLLARNEERTTAPVVKPRAKLRMKGTNQEHPARESETVREAYVPPSLERVTALLSSHTPDGEDANLIGLMKYHLISALFQARSNVNLIGFDEAIKTGCLQKSIQDGFGRFQATKYKEITSNIVKAWEISLVE